MSSSVDDENVKFNENLQFLITRMHMWLTGCLRPTISTIMYTCRNDELSKIQYLVLKQCGNDIDC